MAKIAVGVAILPPDNIMDLAIELNRKFDSLSKLNKENNFPHITLAMGVIDDSEIDLVNQKIKEISKKFGTLDLEIIAVSASIKPNGKKSWAFDIELSDKLKELHIVLMKELLPLFTYDVTVEMFNQDDKVDPISTLYIKDFAKKYQYPNYNPHISLKCNEDVVFTKVPIKFKSSRIALCHLGDHCTCRKIL